MHGSGSSPAPRSLGGSSGDRSLSMLSGLSQFFTQRTTTVVAADSSLPLSDPGTMSLSNHTNHTIDSELSESPFKKPAAPPVSVDTHHPDLWEEELVAPSDRSNGTLDVNVTWSEGAGVGWERTNVTSFSSLNGSVGSEQLEEQLDEQVEGLLINMSSAPNGSRGSEYDDDDEDDDEGYGDYDDDSDEDTDWYYNADDDGRDYYDERGGLESTNRADTGNDDYEYETSDRAVEDMRPGGDNYYRGAKISDEEWIRQRSKVDMSDIGGSHPGQEVFVGPHTFEAEFGPISEVRSETMEMHQPFVPESSHDASLSILVFYTWISIVTVMVIGAFIALKHRHRIANYVWDARTGYRKKGTVCATEEGRNLLTTVM